MSKKNILFFVGIVLLSMSCAHYRDVRPSSSGDHYVSFLTERKGEGFKEGFAQAKDYCDDVMEKKALQVKEKSEYVGSMDEDDYNKAKTASKLVGAIGGAGAVFGGKKEKKAGGVAAVGGGIADSSLGKGYKYTMWFKCK